MKKPKVIKLDRCTLVGEEREGRYWHWDDCNDRHPGAIYKHKDSYFQAHTTYQEYQGEIPKFPKEKTAEEKLEELEAELKKARNAINQCEILMGDIYDALMLEINSWEEE